jgi:hypothetical protein
MSEALVKRLKELEDERDEIEEAMAEIRGQLDRAKAHTAATGEYADRQWYNAAKHALRMKGVDHQAVLREAAEIRRQVAAATRPATLERPFSSYFQRAARELLPAAGYDEIYAEAERLQEAQVEQ